MNSTNFNQPEGQIDSDDDLSDIVSVAGESTNGEVKEVKVSRGRGRGRKGKKEVNL